MLGHAAQFGASCRLILNDICAHEDLLPTFVAAAGEPDIVDNTIVVFTTDNGAEVMSHPDGGCTPFRGEKATNWEGGFARR